MSFEEIILKAFREGSPILSTIIFIVFLIYRDNKYSSLLEKVISALTDICSKLKTNQTEHKDMIHKLEKVKDKLYNIK